MGNTFFDINISFMSLYRLSNLGAVPSLVLNGLPSNPFTVP